MSKKSSKPQKQKFINTLTGRDALVILRTLAKKDEEWEEKIEQAAEGYLAKVDIEGLADKVFCSLNRLEVEELWETAGSDRYGDYTAPGERSWEMFGEVLEPYIKQLKKYKKLLMPEQARDYCLGVIKGIDRYSCESESEFKDWADDAPLEYESQILEEWREGVTKKELKEMDHLINEHLPDWEWEGDWGD